MKKQFQASEARAVGSELVTFLGGSCERIKIAGSLRRGAATVGDVEILMVSRTKSGVADLFGAVELISLALERIDQLLDRGVIEKRLNQNGSATWGAQNRLAVHRASGIPIDFFLVRPESWWSALVCRTGPAKLNQFWAQRALKRGFRWDPYGAGFRSMGDGRSFVYPIHSEEEFFKFLDLPYLDPRSRRA